VFSFIETRLFTRLVREYLTDEEYRKLQAVLMGNPETGNIIPAQAAFGNFAGVRRGEENAAGTA
jgi:hypothetical protein